MGNTPARIFHDADADPRALAGRTVAVIGYGNQGRSQALNIRDSGVPTIVGNIDDDYAVRARADGFAVFPIAEACARADVVMLLVPDEIYPMASQLHNLLIKTHVQDRAKIEAIKQVVADHFDVDMLLERLDQLTFPHGVPFGAASTVPAETAGARALVRKGLQRLADGASRLGGVSRD